MNNLRKKEASAAAAVNNLNVFEHGRDNLRKNIEKGGNFNPPTTSNIMQILHSNLSEDEKSRRINNAFKHTRTSLEQFHWLTEKEQKALMKSKREKREKREKIDFKKAYNNAMKKTKENRDNGGGAAGATKVTLDPVTHPIRSLYDKVKNSVKNNDQLRMHISRESYQRYKENHGHQNEEGWLNQIQRNIEYANGDQNQLNNLSNNLLQGFSPVLRRMRRGGKRKTRRKRGGSDPEEDKCPICLERLQGDKPIIDVHKNSNQQENEKTAGADKHYFHLDCVNQLKRSIPGNKCPSCRQDMNYFERLVGNNERKNNNNNHNPQAPLGRHGQRLARQGAIIAHDARRRLRFDPIAGRRAARERLEAEARSGRGLGGGKRRKTKRKRKRRRKTRRRRRRKKRKTRKH